MFGLDLWEILIILVVAVIFINPKDMPRFFRAIGKLYGQWRSLTFTLNRTIKTAIQEETDRALNQLTAPAGSATSDPGPDPKAVPDPVSEAKPLTNPAAQGETNTPVDTPSTTTTTTTTTATPTTKVAKQTKKKQPAANSTIKKKTAASTNKKSPAKRRVNNYPRKSLNTGTNKKGAQS